MKMKGRRFRPLFTLLWVGLGALAGDAVAKAYLSYVESYLRGETTGFLLLYLPEQLNQQDMTLLRVFFVVVFALFGFVVERLAFEQASSARKRWEAMAPQDKFAFFVGVLLGLMLTALIRNILGTPDWINAALAILLCYTSVLAMESVKEQFRFYFPSSMPVAKGDTYRPSRPKLLDTNVIIDGRISDICRAGFMEGPIYVPRFVLEELQQIADSSDSLKRARGRRGLDILKAMQKDFDLQVPEFATDDPAEEVDSRLVRLALDVDGAIVTNDYNLNGVAELQGVDVLNINELANALKPVVLPGEEMQVTIIREGKEKDQGIGYLDDGTMIVVEGARRLIGETLGVNVTSVLQTVQGKMIFAKIRENGEPTSSVDGSIRTSPGGRPRRKIR